MSFCFNFDLPAQTTDPGDVDGNELQHGNKDHAAVSVSNISLPMMCHSLSYSEYSKYRRVTSNSRSDVQASNCGAVKQV